MGIKKIHFKRLISNDNTRNILLILLYKLTFDLVYIFNISKLYGYTGFAINYNIFKYIILTIVFLFTLKPITSLYYSAKLSSIALIFFTLIYFIPGLSYLSFVKVKMGYIIYYLLFWFMMFFWNHFMKNFKVNLFKKGDAKLLFYLSVIISILLVVYISWKYTNLRFHVNIFDVYKLRAEERKMEMSTLTQYIIPIIGKILPILLIFFLTQKKRFLSFLLVFIQLLLFGIGGHKAYLFSLIVAFSVYFLYKKERIPYIVYGFIFINIFALIQGFFENGYSIFSSFIHHRVQLLPNQIAYYIYDFMQKNELLYLRESILRFFGFQSPYDKSLFFIIGEQYYKNSFTRANTGLCGDAYSQFGFISFFFYSFFIPLAFSLIDNISKGINRSVLIVMVILYVNAFINGSFFSVLLTNGFIMTGIVLYLLSSKNFERQ